MIVVVGKGPSLKDKGFGEWIDRAAIVIRTAGGGLDKDYGSRTDYVIVTSLALPEIKQSNLNNVKGVWIHKTRKTFNYVLKNNVWSEYIPYIKNELGFRGEVEFVSNRYWMKMYRDRSKKTSNPRVNYPSKGTVAALAAMERFKNKIICLAGFDFIIYPERNELNHHDFRVEKQLLIKAAIRYDKQIFTLVKEL